MCRDTTPATLPLPLTAVFQLMLVASVVLAGILTTSVGAIHDAESCWNDGEECLIHATLHRIDEPLHLSGLTMEIDCQTKMEEMPKAVAVNNNAPAFLLRRLEHAASLLLDGCHTPLGVQTYGMEYLPNCDSVPKVLMERFHGDTLLAFNCPNANNTKMQVEMLTYRNNELATIAASAFINLPELRELYFERNALRQIVPTAFDGLRVVECIRIAEEPLLALKDESLFERTGVVDLQLVHLKYINNKLFQHLPETLRHLLIAHTTFDNNTVIVSNPQLLRNISINGCTLNSFALLESTQTISVQHINLSDNALIEFRVDFLRDGVGDGNTTTTIAAVETLDLSKNELTYLPLLWLNSLRKLRHLLLHDNRLTELSLPSLMRALPFVMFLDLRKNKLSTFADASTSNASTLSWQQIRIQIDHNPWNCLWLLKFAHIYPERFRIFQYEKFISQINVNGLKCQPVEVPTSSPVIENITEPAFYHVRVTAALPPLSFYNNNHQMPRLSPPSRHAINASTYKLIYGGPWDYKRNQRAEALVIVFLLPVGVAFLFILLYMWIKCQKVFHLSFYRSFTWSQRHIGTRLTSAERFDVIRQLPPLPNALNVNQINNNDNYETPLNGIASVCNCHSVSSTTSTYANEKCRKLHHITYEELPSEQPCKIYEEIIGDDETDAVTYAQPFYDHLSFTQPTKSDSDRVVD